ncbi:MAG: hypothetical protein ABW003_26920 [Microvirga sp.]
MPKQVAYEPMTLANMRAHGMTRLEVTCHAPDCGHRAMVDVSKFGDDVIVSELGSRFWCSRCGSRNVDARPGWIQYANTIALYRSPSRPSAVASASSGPTSKKQSAKYTASGRKVLSRGASSGGGLVWCPDF